MAAPDHYKTLGVARNATDEQISVAYRSLVTKYHPDLNPGNAQAAETFKKINKAYETLRDKAKRQAYDAAQGGGTARPPQRPQQTRQAQGPAPTGGPFDVLQGMRDQMRRNTGAGDSPAGPAAAGSAPMVELVLTPREALEGTTKTIRVNGRDLRIRIRVRR